MSTPIPTNAIPTLPADQMVERVKGSRCPDCDGSIPASMTGVFYKSATPEDATVTRDQLAYCEHCNMTHVDREQLKGAAWTKGLTGKFRGNHLPPEPDSVVTSPAPRRRRRATADA